MNPLVGVSCSVFGGLLWVGSASGQSLVTGFERFHAEPSALGGALLYSELGCVNCHGGGAGLAERNGPVLAGLDERVEAAWVLSFLSDPQGAKKGTMMPAMLDGVPEAERMGVVEAVTHYLMGLKPLGPPSKEKSARHANAERGSALYHEKGCVACHAPTADYDGAEGLPDAEDYEWPAVPFPELQKKYSLTSLSSFLQNPAVVRPDGRMPHVQLDAQDTLDVAAHLVDFQDSDPRQAGGLKAFKVDASKAKVGGEWVARLNCAACHSLTMDSVSRRVPLKLAEGGCMSEEGVAGRPHYSLSEGQRAALEAYLKEAPLVTPAAKADLTLQALNCLACHQRDGVGGPDAARDRFFEGDEGIADAGRLPPPLTGIGQKLRAEWMTKVFEGGGRVRPYVKTQMPAYAQHAGGLTALFQDVDRRPELPEMVGGDVKAGHKLLGIQGGVNCITCHQWGERPSLGIQALDISELDKRLQPEWFRDYLLLPAAYRPGTLMPPLWPGGQSMVKDVLEGDAEKQIASIWAFIENGEGLPEGYPDHVTGAFELIPTDRAVIQRTFLNGVGAHAILVGFPGGVNLAYDGLAGRPAKLWKGRFFDAYSTWFVRAAPFEDPLEEAVLDWPAGSEGDAEVEFGGYQVDGAGNPTFVLRVEGKSVRDSYQAVDGKLKRVIKGEWPGVGHPMGADVERVAAATGGEEQTFIYSWQ